MLEVMVRLCFLRNKEENRRDEGRDRRSGRERGDGEVSKRDRRRAGEEETEKRRKNGS